MSLPIVTSLESDEVGQILLTADSLKCLRQPNACIESVVIFAYLRKKLLMAADTYGKYWLLVSPDSFPCGDGPTGCLPFAGDNVVLRTYPAYHPDWKFALMPICNRNHWFLAVAFRQDGTVRVFDTKHGDHLASVRDRLSTVTAQLFENNQFNIVEADPSKFVDQKDDWSSGCHVCMISDRLLIFDDPFNCNTLTYGMKAVQNWKNDAYKILSAMIPTNEPKPIDTKSEALTVNELPQNYFETSVTTFNLYYPEFFDKRSSYTLLIPTSNDITGKYFLGKLEEGDHPRNYEKKFIDEIKHKGTLLMANAATIEDGKKMIAKAEKMKTDKESNEEQWKEKLKNCKNNRNRIAEYRVMKAFYDAKNIGGILILSPKMNESLIKYLEKIRTGKHGEQSKWAETILQKYKNNDEICDFIYFHPHLGIYVIEVKASEKLDRRTAKEKSEWAAANTENLELIARLKEDIKRLETKVRNLNTERDKARHKKHELKEAAGEKTNSAVKAIEEAIEEATKQREEAKDKIDTYKKRVKIIEIKISSDKEKFLSNEYEKAVYQLDGKLKSKEENDEKSSELPETWTIMKLFYLLLTSGCSNGMSLNPAIYGIVCFPNAQLSESTRQHVESKYRHFDSDIILSTEKFEQFWNHEMTKNKNDNDLFDDINYQKFISTMANCSVGRDLLGVKNSIEIAKRIASQDYGATTTTNKKLEVAFLDGQNSIFLNAEQMKILNDTSKLKLIFGPPGTGKTILTILAAIAAAEKKRRTVQIKIPIRDYLTHQLVYSITQNETRSNSILLAQIELLSKFARMKCQKGKVIVFTQYHLVEYMKRIFKMNGFDENTIEMRDFVVETGELNVNDYIFVDECSAEESDVQNWLNFAKQLIHGKIFFAITKQNKIDELCSIKEQIMQLLNNENDYRIFQLTEILRGTKSIIDFWINRFNQILPKELQMECGHSIVGENVDYYGQYMKSDEIMDKMVERLKALLDNNERKNIAIICRYTYEKQKIESTLNDQKIAFGSTIKQDTDHSLIAVELDDNVFSREWPFVIFVDLFPHHHRQISIISSSRAIAHLTLIERNVKKIRSEIRDKCNDYRIETILSSLEEYTQFRSKNQLFDYVFILCHDLWIDIISFNYFPSQIKQLYPNIFNDCNTFGQFFDIIVNKEQWMLLLFVHQWEYFQEWRPVNESINLIIEYKQSTEWIELYEIEKMRAECLINNAKSAIELIKKFIQPQVQEMMDKVVTDNWQLFEVFNNSNGIDQFDLMACSIRKIITTNCSRICRRQELEIDTNGIDYVIGKLLLNLNQQQPQPSTVGQQQQPQ